ncbi:putative Fis-like DNA-binding protein [Methylophilaceae bacterium]|nr:putative Fis-like DNA-binding protein [Methylophilaceae bacterium]
MEKKTDIPDCVNESLDQYFKDLDGEHPTNVYDMVIGMVEKPLISYIMGISKAIKVRLQKSLALIEIRLEKN